MEIQVSAIYDNDAKHRFLLQNPYECVRINERNTQCAGVMELADVRDSKSRVREDVRVRPPPPALSRNHDLWVSGFSFYGYHGMWLHLDCFDSELPAIFSYYFLIKPNRSIIGSEKKKEKHFYGCPVSS